METLTVVLQLDVTLQIHRLCYVTDYEKKNMHFIIKL